MNRESETFTFFFRREIRYKADKFTLMIAFMLFTFERAVVVWTNYLKTIYVNTPKEAIEIKSGQYVYLRELV